MKLIFLSLVGLLILAQAKVEATAALEEACTADTDCGANTACTESKCACKPSYSKISASDCNKKLGEGCSKTSDCGSNTACTSGTCGCATGNKADGVWNCKKIPALGEPCTQSAECGTGAACSGSKCACNSGFTPEGAVNCKKSVLLGEVCAQDTDCGGNACCLASKCACKIGYAKDTTTDCVTMKCQTSKQCTQAGFDNTECRESECVCTSGHELSLDGTQCDAHINERCDRNQDCSKDVLCGTAGKCICPFGMIVDEKHPSRCKIAECSGDTECQKFGTNAECWGAPTKDAIPCVCPKQQYKLNVGTQLCEQPIYANMNNKCKSDADCVDSKSNANPLKCINKHCHKCAPDQADPKMGVLNKQTCQRVHCTHHNDCEEQDLNSVCNSENLCSCKKGYSIGDKEFCAKGAAGTPTVGFAALTVLLIVSLAFCAQLGANL